MNEDFDFGSSDDEIVDSEPENDSIEKFSDSDDELSISDEEDSSWTSKDGTRWEQNIVKPDSKVGRKRSYEILRTRPGVTSYATAHVNNEVQAFKASFDDSLITLVISHANEKGFEKCREN